MAYPLNTFNDAQPAPAPRTGVGRFTQEVVLVLGLALIIFATMALASYSPHDAAWSTSGTGGPLHNWAGKLGAWLADVAYVALGFSAWWCLPDGSALEVNHVDAGRPTAFWYAEVEYPTVAAANAWQPAAWGLADYLSDEVTGQPGQSMGAYWLQTRG